MASNGMKRIQSEPAFNVLRKPHHKRVRKRRKSTVLHPSQYYHPRMVLQLVLSQPSHALLGIGLGPNLRPLIELTIRDLQTTYGNDNSSRCAADDKLIDEALLRLELEEFKSFVPLKASIANFEMILDQRYTQHLIYAILHALVGSFLAGYNTSLLNVPAHLIESECILSLTQFSLLQSMYCVGGLLGAIIAGYGADKWGRRLTLLFANTMFMASGLISMLYAFGVFGAISIPSISYRYFILSRIISGLASGICTAIVPTYLGEISPPIIRGEIGTLNAFINAFGILFAEILGFEYLLGDAATWQYIFIINILPTAAQLLFIKTFCESPQWLLYNNRRKEAEQVFIWLRHSQNVEFDMRSIKTKKLYDKITIEPSPKGKENKIFPFDEVPSEGAIAIEEGKIDEDEEIDALLVFNDDYGAMNTMDDEYEREHNKSILIYIFFMTICLQILQQFSGINSVWYYSSIMLNNAGLTSSFQLWIGNVLIASSNFFGVLIPVNLIEKLGRKLLIYLSCIGMIFAEIFLTLILMFAHDLGDSAGYLSIIILILYVISFAMGLGPIVGLLTVELSPSSHRGFIVSVAFFINYSANLFVAQYANQLVQYVYYIPFAVVCASGIVFTYFCIPETKGKKENDIQAEIAYKITKSQPIDIYG